MPHPPRGPRGPGGPVSDIERFLMEVERLRKKAASEHPVEEVEVVDEVEVVRPAPRPAPPPPPVRQAPRPRPRPVEAVPVLEAVPVRPTLAQSIDSAAAASIKAQATPRVATFRTGPPGGANAQQIMTMLRSKQQLVTGILLAEILGPPACRRRARP